MEAYPSTPFEQPRELFRLVRSFWTNVFDDRESIHAVLSARGEAESMNWGRLEAGLRCFGRQDTPEVVSIPWYPVELLESSRLSVVPFLDGGFDLDGSQLLDRAGDSIWEWPVPREHRDAGVLSVGIGRSGKILVSGIDYWFVSGRLHFLENPFDDPELPIVNVTEAGEVVDRRMLLWAGGLEVDRDYVYSRWGRVVGLQSASSPRYLSLVNLALDCVTTGTSDLALRRFLGEAYGSPVSVASETVASVSKDNRGWVVTTGLNLYRAPETATPAVAVGDEVQAGQPLFQEMEFHSLNRGGLPDSIRALGLGQGLLAGKYQSELVFENRLLPTSVTVSPQGEVLFRFPIGGTEDDVAEFWRRSPGLAEALDRRSDPLGPPSALNLPTEINPAVFVADNFFRGNCLLVRLRTSGASMLPGIEAAFSSLLRRLTPPGMLVLLFVEMSPPPFTTRVRFQSALASDEAAVTLTSRLSGAGFRSSVTTRNW